MLFQISKGTLDGGAGEAKVGRNGVDPRPAFPFGRGHTFEVHVYCLGTVRQPVIGIDGIKIADPTTSYVLTWGAAVFGIDFAALSSLVVFLHGYFSIIARISSSRPA